MKIPNSTYRLQFNPQFNFAAASGILDYLKQLGISDIYSSPVLKARTNSVHGYDLVDPARINPQLGPEEGFRRLLEEVRAKGLGWIQDIVPNHLAYDAQNIYLNDIFEKGEQSIYRDFFDIQWDHPHENLRGKALAPFLAEFYGSCLDKGQIQLRYGQDGFYFNYADFSFSLRIIDYPEILKNNLGDLENELRDADDDRQKFLGIIQTLEGLEQEKETGQRYKQTAAAKQELWELYQRNERIRSRLDRTLKEINGAKDNPGSFDRMHELLRRQNFRFSFWKVGNDELNYRRFFTINGLLSVKIERDDVFELLHKLVFALLENGLISGLRIDHVDGLSRPLEYLRRLRARFQVYTVAEKILDLFESLPEEASLEGTTGYDFLNFVNGIFIQKKNEKNINKIYTAFTGASLNYGQLLRENKRMIMREYMAGDIENLARPLVKLLAKSRYGQDFTMYALKRAIVEMLAHFPVYRTYVDNGSVNPREESYIKEAATSAKNNNPALLFELEIIERILLLNYGAGIPEQEKEEWLNFIRRFQQLSSSAMAKGLEDTLFYVYNRFISLNEVGGNPLIFGIQLKDFHDFNLRRAQRWKHTLNATSTHDTKMGEDVRARINVLSEIPREWSIALKEFSRINRPLKKISANLEAPENNDEYRIYQTLVGAYPFAEAEAPEFAPRMKEYIIKAVREAKVHTGWIRPDAPYEEACLSFIDGLFDQQKNAAFLQAFLPFQKRIEFFGIFNSLSQTLLKIASPGAPDFYQGSELWNLSLVDPDNRRPVDFAKNSAYLSGIIEKEKAGILPLIADLFAAKEDGRIKQFLIYRGLKARNQYAALFREGSYSPLKTGGIYKDHVVAFLREHEGQRFVIAVPRFLTGLVKENELPLGSRVWLDTFISLPKKTAVSWIDAVSGQAYQAEDKLLLAQVFQHFPGALLIGT